MSKSKINWGKTGLFAAGVAFGTAGIKLLSAKDCVMKTVSTVQENCSDIYSDAKSINEDRAAKEEAVYEDFADDFSEVKNEEEVKEETKAE